MKRLSKKQKIIIGCSIAAVLLIAIIIVAVVLLTKDDKKDVKSKEQEQISKTKEEEKEEVSIIDINSNSRPFAVMINNINEARLVQSGISKAYIVYELLAEGGITRLMAVFKDADVGKLGSIRSARDYYLDYAMENDAIYVHWGWSPQAQIDIPTLGINNLNGLYDQGFYRLSPGEYPAGLAYEHTGFTNMDNLKAAAEQKGYRMTSDKDSLLSYSDKSVDYSKEKSYTDATNVVLTYSNYTQVTYQYDAENKNYKRINLNNQANIDHETEKQVTAKNIIVYQVNCYQIAGDEKGRIKVENLGNGTGYYISEGKAITIKWSKETRSSQTKYTLEDGSELKVNDGNTFIQILPTTGKVAVS